jgi:riboflavin kinase
MRPDKPRDPVAGPDAGPESPYPVRLSGPVIKGFGRGSKDVCRAVKMTGFLSG